MQALQTALHFTTRNRDVHFYFNETEDWFERKSEVCTRRASVGVNIARCVMLDLCPSATCTGQGNVNTCHHLIQFTYLQTGTRYIAALGWAQSNMTVAGAGRTAGERMASICTRLDAWQPQM